MSSSMSTLRLCELVASNLGSKSSIDEVLKVWHSVGKTVLTQLKAGKGTRLNQLGLFSLTSGRKPTFAPANDLLKSYKLKAKVLPAPENVPTALLNYTQLAQISGASRESCERIYNAFVKAVGRTILEGRDVMITIHRVAEITITGNTLSVEFMQASPEKKVSPRAVPATAPEARSTKTKDPWDAKNARAQARAKAAAKEAADMALYLEYQQEKEEPKFKAQNNIFTSGSDISAKTPPPRSRNPMLDGDADGPVSSERYNPFEDLPPYQTKKALKRADRERHSGNVPQSREQSAQARAAAAAAAAVRDVTAPEDDALSALASADVDDLLMSPRSQLSAVDSAAVQQPPQGVRRGRGGSAGFQSQSYLRKETLDRHAAMQARRAGSSASNKAAKRAPGSRESEGGAAAALGGAGGLDARAIAAKALANEDIALRIREKVVERGGSNGIRSLQRLLMIMDDNGDKRLTKEELKYGLRDYGLDLSPSEIDQAFVYFDRDRNGFVDITEFLVGIRGELNERRKKIIRLAFDILDKDGSGFVTVEEIADVYDVSANPDVQCGKKTIDEALVEFLNQWENSAEGTKDGIVTYEEFEDYYKEISASIDGDDYFELMMRNAWRIAGGEGQAANTANLRVLVTDKDGKQKVATVEQELGLKQGDKEEIIKRLTKQGVDASNVELYGGMDSTEKPNKTVRSARGGSRATLPTPPSHEAHAKSPPLAPLVKETSSEVAPSRAAMLAAARDAAVAKSVTGPSEEKKESESQREAHGLLHDTLYNPPCNLEKLGGTLQVSVVTFVPRLARGHFVKRMGVLLPKVPRAKVNEMWKILDPENVGSVELEKMHSFLASRYGRDRSAAKGMGVIDRVRQRVLERCGQQAGIKGLQRTLMIMDDNGDKRLTKEELKYGLSDYGIDLNIRELDEIFLAFDRDRNGFVDITEFLVGIRGELNERRKKIIRLAFDILDKDGSGFVTVEEIADVYDVSANPDVQCGKKTIEEALKDFLGQWERGEKDGIVTYEEFEDHYKEISASIDGDDYFELMMRNAWRIAGGEGQAANTANLRVLVTDKDGKQKVATVEQELGLKQGDKEEIIKRLTKQGVDASNVELYGGMDSTEKPNKAVMKRGSAARAMAGPAAANAKAIPPPRQLESKAGVNVGNPRLAYNRNVAAMKLAAAFRGRVGRKKALAEKRKAAAAAAAAAEIEAEKKIPRARKLIRPQPKRK